jgi:hypothetical protein
VSSLPNDSVFIEKLTSADNGTNFLRKFGQLLKMIAMSIVEAFNEDVSVLYVYKKKKIAQTIKNIEKTLNLKDEHNPVKEDSDEVDDNEDLNAQDEDNRPHQLN